MLFGLPEVSTDQALSVVESATGGALPPTVMLATFAIALARIIGFMMVAPFFGSMNIPMTARVGLAVILATVVTPLIADDAGMAVMEVSTSGWHFMMLLVNQVLIGLALGLVGAFVFYAIESAGRIIDVQRGSNITDVIAPQTGDRTSPSGQWLMMVALMVLITSGQHLLMLDALLDSFSIFRPTASLDWVGNPANGFDKNDAVFKIVELSGQSLLITIKIAAPAMLSLMLADVLLGIINRGAPQVNVFALSQVIKGPIGIGGMLVALTAILGYVEHDAIPSIYEGKNSIRALAELMSNGVTAGK